MRRPSRVSAIAYSQIVMTRMELLAASWRRPSRLLMLVCLAVLWVGPRIPHLTGPIDEPMSWRQCDTAQYAYSFFREEISLLRPPVAWMGSHKTVVLEFPLPELLMAMAYRAFGHHLELARLVTLTFFLASACYLALIVRRLFGSRLAFSCVAIYGVLPLGLFYSRAIHIDFAAVFCAHALVYHSMRACDEGSWPMSSSSSISMWFTTTTRSHFLP